MISLVIKKRLDATPGESTEAEYITTDELDAEGEEITVHKADHIHGADIMVCGSFMTWEQVDALRNAIDAAEKRWRLESTRDQSNITAEGYIDGDILKSNGCYFVLVERGRYGEMERDADRYNSAKKV